MANDITDTLRDALGQAVREAIGNMGSAPEKPKSGRLPGGKGLLAGAGLAAAAPLAKKGLDALQNGSVDDLITRLRERVETGDDDEADAADDEAPDQEPTAGGAGDEPDDDDGGDDDDSGEERGGGGGPQATGKGRRMPIQQAIDVAVPLETAYNQFAQFEDWPEFMHRVTRVSQEDEATINFATKIWGKTKEFTATIETQRPDERIKWKVSQGITHSGVVTFHELAPRLTRIEVTLDVDPGSLLEKAARGMRHIKRAVRADLHRYKAFIEMQESETGAWRGVIEDGEVVEPHDDSYDEERDYSEVDDIHEMGERSGDGEGSGDEKDEDEESEPAQDEEEHETVAASDEDEEDDEEQPRARPQRSHGSRTRSRNENGRKPAGSGGERRRKARAG